jgi:hypothetical protein
VQRLLLREAARLRREAQGGAREPHQILGVAGIHDREVPRQPRLLAEDAEQPVPGRVERPPLHAPAHRPDEPLGARQHLSRGAPREGEQEDPLRRHPPVDEMRDAIDQRPGLPRAGAGDDQEGAVAVRGGAQLRDVQLRRVVASGCQDLSRAGGVEAGSVGHRQSI